MTSPDQILSPTRWTSWNACGTKLICWTSPTLLTLTLQQCTWIDAIFFVRPYREQFQPPAFQRADLSHNARRTTDDSNVRLGRLVTFTSTGRCETITSSINPVSWCMPSRNSLFMYVISTTTYVSSGSEGWPWGLGSTPIQSPATATSLSTNSRACRRLLEAHGPRSWRPGGRAASWR